MAQFSPRMGHGCCVCGDHWVIIASVVILLTLARGLNKQCVPAGRRLCRGAVSGTDRDGSSEDWAGAEVLEVPRPQPSLAAAQHLIRQQHSHRGYCAVLSAWLLSGGAMCWARRYEDQQAAPETPKGGASGSADAGKDVQLVQMSPLIKTSDDTAV